MPYATTTTVMHDIRDEYDENGQPMLQDDRLDEENNDTLDIQPLIDVARPHQKTPRMGEALLACGLITRDHLAIALREQKQLGQGFSDSSEPRMLGDILVRLGFLEEDKLTDYLALRTGVSKLAIQDTRRPCANILRAFPEDAARRCLALPLRYDGTRLIIAMADPYDIVASDEVRRHFPQSTDIVPRVTGRTQLLALISDSYTSARTLADILEELETTPSTTNSQDHPVVRLVDAVLDEAMHMGASDVHFEPENSYVRVRCRIDGLLRQTLALHSAHWGALSHRLKIMAGMNIADTRSIQDGRFQIAYNNRAVDCRVAVMPGMWGETIVVRLLDSHRAMLDLGQLGFGGYAETQILNVLDKPQGLVIVTGPTGSGKTTSLYAFLRHVNSPALHIATLEDPIEYQMDHVRQTSINPAQGIDFASGVRGLLRMDPDKLFIGEIRDADTAQMTLRAAMTGHQVFTTLHANDSVGAIPRLIDLGLNARVLSGNVSGIVAQRLARRLCASCRIERSATQEEAKIISSLCHARDAAGSYKIYDAKGCPDCAHTGASGRTVIAEVLNITPAIEDMIAANKERAEILRQARTEGFRSMQQSGISKVLSGEISLDELRRVVDISRGCEL